MVGTRVSTTKRTQEPAQAAKATKQTKTLEDELAQRRDAVKAAWEALRKAEKELRQAAQHRAVEDFSEFQEKTNDFKRRTDEKFDQIDSAHCRIYPKNDEEKRWFKIAFHGPETSAIAYHWNETYGLVGGFLLGDCDDDDVNEFNEHYVRLLVWAFIKKLHRRLTEEGITDLVDLDTIRKGLEIAEW